MGKQMPYECSDVIATEEAEQAPHLPGWISFAQVLNGKKSNLSDEGHIFFNVQLVRTGRPCTG